MHDLKAAWQQAWADLGLPAPAGLFEALVAAYEEPQRHYHSLQHLAECLAHCDQVRHLARHPGEVAVALWFHDAVYDVQGKSNEQQSADWAVRALTAAGATPERFAEYDRQVRAEYSWVPGLIYRVKRKAVLKSFLDREHIYNTSYFRERCEARARSNLTAACA
ncbi:MAG: HD domain-containing protein [Hydrogenophaga sp.]|uniref:HD domain-containing protein n=1 Tax=Hydrogenophaga sp. TaxID=1904254 RepID=UPI0040362564